MAVSTGAMVDFLQKVYLMDTSYADKGKYLIVFHSIIILFTNVDTFIFNLVFEDIKLLQQRHFAAFDEMNEAMNSNSFEKSNPSSSVSAATNT
jgi:hypothetical protein